MGRIIIPMRRQRDPLQQAPQYARPNVEAPIDTINKWAPLVKTALDVGVAGGSRLFGALRNANANNPSQPQDAPVPAQNAAPIQAPGDAFAEIVAQRTGAPTPTPPPSTPMFGIGGSTVGQPQGVIDLGPVAPPSDSDLMMPGDTLPAYTSESGIAFPSMLLHDTRRATGPEYNAGDASYNSMIAELNAQRSADELAKIAAARSTIEPQDGSIKAPAVFAPSATGMDTPQLFSLPQTQADPAVPASLDAIDPFATPQAAPVVGQDSFVQTDQTAQQALMETPEIALEPQRMFSGPVSMANLRALAAEAGRTRNEDLAREVMQKFVEADGLDVYPDNFMDWVTGAYQDRAQQELVKLMDPGGATMSPLQIANLESMIRNRDTRTETEKGKQPGVINQATGKGQVALAAGANAPAQQAAKTSKAQADALIAQVRAAYAPILEKARIGNAEAIAQKNAIEARLAQKLEEMGVPQAQEVAKLALTKAQTTAALMNAGSNRIKAQSYAAWVAKYTPYIPKDVNLGNRIVMEQWLRKKIADATEEKAMFDAVAAGKPLDARTAIKLAQADFGRAGGAMLSDAEKRADAKEKAAGKAEAILQFQRMLDDLPDQQ